MSASIEFEKLGDSLVLAYTPRDDDEWVHERFKRGEELRLKGTFRLRASDLLPLAESEDPDERPVRFHVGDLRHDYYVVAGHVLETGLPVLLHRDCSINWKWFTAERRVSVFAQIAKLRPARIVIGGPASDAIPEAEFVRLIGRFPSGHELRRYSLARVAAVVREYTDTTVDAERLYQRTLERRLDARGANLTDIFRESEEQKFRILHDRLRVILEEEESYPEARWQAEILQIIRLLNPRYIQAFEKVRVRDVDSGTTREIDILLVDASGNVDLIEIKKPFDKNIVSLGTYRANHIPLRELSGSIMQIEKYIYYLNRWGAAGEAALTARFATKLPDGFRIRITNPSGMVIVGRDSNLTPAQRRDFEIVKRKYKNIVDIITYDDLLRRLDFVLRQLSVGA